MYASMQGCRVPLLFVAGLVLLALFPGARATAETLHAVAQVSNAASGLTQTSDGAQLRLGLSRPVPYRVFTLDAPRRLVLDFHEVDWDGLPKQRFVVSDLTRALRFGTFKPGWSRMVLDLDAPMRIAAVELDTASPEGSELEVQLQEVSPEDYAASAQAADRTDWLNLKARPEPAPKTALRIAIDPGHGGVDPGAVRDGVMEKDIALEFSLELARLIEEKGTFDVILTRRSDYSVSLAERVRIARAAEADMFISVHSNTVTWGDASGAAVYTLSERASDAAAAKLAELENRADIAVGLTAQVEGDNVARVLLDLSRLETNARSRHMADALIDGLRGSIGVLRTKPHRSAGFRVLKAHEIPSVLLELGFLSNLSDRENMQSPAWQRKAALAVVNALETWMRDDKARADLILK